MKELLRRSVKPQNLVKILIAILFSIIAIVGGFSSLAYVPLAGSKAIDVTIVAVMFASLIGGYGVAVPLAIVWALVTHYNLDPEFRTWPLWAMVFVREAFLISTVWLYYKFKETYKYSPMNVYRAIFVGIFIRNLISIPIDIMYRKTGWMVLRGEQFIIEVGLCSVFMILLIKHLRQIHILNGVKKKEKGEKKNGHQDITIRPRPY